MLDKLLTYDLSDLMNVEVVSASKGPERINECPATVRVITAEEIKERGYQTLEEALSGLPGFQFRDISGYNSYAFLRGLPSQNNLILVLVDGVQINELNSGGFYGGAQYNLANVKRIEVVYGPASALYGTNAVSGIINIITNDPRDIQGANGGALAGGFGTRAMDFNYGWYDEAGDYGVSLSGKLSRTEKDDLGGARGDYNWSGNMENFEEDESFDGKILYKGLTLGVLMQDKNSSMTTAAKTAGTDYLDYGTNWHIRFINAYLKHVYDKNPGWSLESRAYYRNATVMPDTVYAVNKVVCSTCGQEGDYRPNDLIGLESRLNLELSERLDLTLGAVLENENLALSYSTTYSGDPLVAAEEPGNPPMVTNNLLSLYGQARYEISPGLKFTGGLRYDDSSSYGEVNTPRAGLVYNKDELTLKLLYAEAFRAPKPWDYYYRSGNSGLGPEKMRSTELSGVYAFSTHLMAELSVYRNKMEDLLVFSTVRDSWVNSGDVATRGGEARLEFAKGPVKTYLNYAFQESEDEDGEDVAEIARHNAGIGFLYAFSGKVRLDLATRYLGGRKNTRIIAATGSDHVGSALVTDATLSLTGARNFNLSLAAKNLFDETYYHTSNRTPDRYLQPGRQFLLQAGYSFGFPDNP